MGKRKTKTQIIGQIDFLQGDGSVGPLATLLTPRFDGTNHLNSVMGGGNTPFLCAAKDTCMTLAANFDHPYCRYVSRTHSGRFLIGLLSPCVQGSRTMMTPAANLDIGVPLYR